MNERIRELFHESISDVDYIRFSADGEIDELLNDELSKMYIPDCFAEKFAELIVKECADLIDNVLEPGSPPNPTLGEQLVKYFRVSEHDKVVAKPKCSVCGTTEKVKYMGGYQPYLCDSVDCIPY